MAILELSEPYIRFGGLGRAVIIVDHAAGEPPSGMLHDLFRDRQRRVNVDASAARTENAH